MSRVSALTRPLPIVLAVAILVVMAVITLKDNDRLTGRDDDAPPRIDFTWSPAGPVSLKEMRAFLTIKDDYALDFTTYRMNLPDVNKTLDLPIEGLIGKEYEQSVSFSLIAEHPGLAGKDKMTVEISIADDRGQNTTITKIIQLKPPEPVSFELYVE